MRSVTTKSLRELGSQLHSTMVELISTDGRLPRPTDLSRWWQLDQTLCVRTCSALKNDDPLRVLHQLSSSGSLRSIVEAGRSRGVDRKVCENAEQAISALEEVISSLGGKKANLDTLIGSQLVEAREKIEATSKQSIFRGMSNLLGLQSDVVLTAYFVTPSSDDDGLCDELAIYGSMNLRRLRPELTTMVGGRVLFGDTSGELARAREILHGGQLDHSGFSVALKEFSTDPFPDVDVSLETNRLLYTLPGDPSGESDEVSMFFASIDRHASRRARKGSDPEVARFIFIPRNPSKEMLLDVFVHRDVWPTTEPYLDIGRGDNVLRPFTEASRLDQFDFCESLQILGSRSQVIPFKPMPLYTSMLESVAESAGYDLSDYRLYRLHVRYPVASLAYGIYFPI